MIGPSSCANHPERPGIGICPTCSRTVCEECSTRVEGILQCRSCLEARVRKGAAHTAWRSASAVLPAILLMPLAWAAVGYGLYGAAVGTAAAARVWERLERMLLETFQF